MDNVGGSATETRLGDQKGRLGRSRRRTGIWHAMYRVIRRHWAVKECGVGRSRQLLAGWLGFVGKGHEWRDIHKVEYVKGDQNIWRWW